MPQENLENETLLVSHSAAFNAGLRAGVQAAMEMEETVDRVIETVITAAIDLEPGEKSDMRNRKAVISVRMSIDEGLGYLGGQRLAHERPYLMVPALDTYANASWFAVRRTRLDRAQYRSGFHEGYFDELAGTASPLPDEQPIAFAY